MQVKGRMLVGLLAMFFFAGISTGCKERLPRIPCDNSSPTWDGEVANIVQANCSGSSCHDPGTSRGDYSTYAGIQADLLNGNFENEVLDSRRMPQNSSLPDSLLAKLQCWLENGFPEN